MFLTFCEDVKRLGNLTYILFGWNPNMTVDDYHTLKAAVLASPSVITGLKILDDKKSPKIEWEFTAEELKVGMSPSFNAFLQADAEAKAKVFFPL